ncbi:PDR/VanB family oxidoreductase [Tianweitania populi]|uniref:Vanillate O-demethylase n=1 Tax=Tianweitania populi TaxID=1607949 RepID=A0A8J3GMU1_9HYPH|nr:PDR/VanB family oxidoreductase [Tianweitania populi]GHD20534.1 vanillate O-demethylase [Tianweitania populi]
MSKATEAQRTKFRVASVSMETPTIRHVVLAPVDARGFDWTPGAHVRVILPAGGDRPYSLLALPHVDRAHCSLGILLEEKSAGGSRFMHALKAGDEMLLSQPENNFALHEGNEPALLFAGGIGVTPIVSMAAELNGRGTAYHVHYAGRAPGALAFLEPLKAICGDRLSVHHDSDETRLDIEAALSAADTAAHIYVCGPSGMIDAVKAAAAEAGFPPERIHFELFKAAAPVGADAPFEVEIASSGQVIEVAADQTIIQALEAAGLDPLYDCQRGDCGICQTTVLAGEPDHRDVILTDEEKASNTVMQICVSRSKSPRLVLDL